MATIGNILGTYVSAVSGPAASIGLGGAPSISIPAAARPVHAVPAPAAAAHGPVQRLRRNDDVISEVAASAEHDARQRLIDSLSQQSRFNNGLIVAIVVVQIALVCLGAVAMYYFRDNSDSLIKVAGGSIIDLAVFPASIARLWHDKVLSDMLRATIPNVGPKEALRVVEGLYRQK